MASNMAVHHVFLFFIFPIIGIICEDSNKHFVEKDAISILSPTAEEILSNPGEHVTETLTWLVNHVQQMERKLEAQNKENEIMKNKIRHLEKSVQICRVQQESNRKIKHKLSALENILVKYLINDYTETPTSLSSEKKELSKQSKMYDSHGGNDAVKKLASRRRLLASERTYKTAHMQLDRRRLPFRVIVYITSYMYLAICQSYQTSLS
jgi:uncharacterized membrane protein YgaE (UPF0421/DUF939 family)